MEWLKLIQLLGFYGGCAFVIYWTYKLEVKEEQEHARKQIVKRPGRKGA